MGKASHGCKRSTEDRNGRSGKAPNCGDRFKWFGFDWQAWLRNVVDGQSGERCCLERRGRKGLDWRRGAGKRLDRMDLDRQVTSGPLRKCMERWGEAGLD